METYETLREIINALRPQSHTDEMIHKLNIHHYVSAD